MRELEHCVRAIGGREQEAERYSKLAARAEDERNAHPLRRWINGESTRSLRDDVRHPTENGRKRDHRDGSLPPYESNVVDMPGIHEVSGSTSGTTE